MPNPNHGRRLVRNAMSAALLAQSETENSVLPAPLVKDDERQSPKPGAVTKRLAIMPENTDIAQEYIGDEGEINHTLILEWSVFAAAGLSDQTQRESLYEAGLAEIAAVFEADFTFSGSCAFARPVRLEELDEDYGGAGALSAGFIFISILLDTASVLR